MKKAIALATALCMLVVVMLTFTACGERVVMQYGNIKITEDVYRYWLSCYKYEYLVMYKQLGIQDTPGGWRQEYQSGKSYNEVFLEQIQRDIARRVVAAATFESEGYALTTAEKKAVTDAIDGIFYYQEVDGERTDRNGYFSEYGTNETGVRKVAAYELQYQLLLSKIFKEDYSGIYLDGLQTEVDRYYRENCRRVRFLLISKDKTEEIAHMDALLNDMNDKVFSEKEKQEGLSELDTVEDYPDGCYLLDDVNYNQTGLGAFPELLKMAYKAEIGQCLRTETEEGVYYLYRGELADRAYRNEDKKYQIMFREFDRCCARSLYYDMMEELAEDVIYMDMPAWILGEMKTNKEFNVLETLGK